MTVPMAKGQSLAGFCRVILGPKFFHLTGRVGAITPKLCPCSAERTPVSQDLRKLNTQWSMTQQGPQKHGRGTEEPVPTCSQQPKEEAKGPGVNACMDLRYTSYTQVRILLSLKREGNSGTCHNMDRTTKSHMLYDPFR